MENDKIHSKGMSVARQISRRFSVQLPVALGLYRSSSTLLNHVFCRLYRVYTVVNEQIYV